MLKNLRFKLHKYRGCRRIFLACWIGLLTGNLSGTDTTMDFTPEMTDWTFNIEARGCFSVKEKVLSFDYFGNSNAFLMRKIPKIAPGETCEVSFEARMTRRNTEDGFACVMVTNANWGPSETIMITDGEWKKYTHKVSPKTVFDHLVIRSKKSNGFEIRNLKLTKNTASNAEAGMAILVIPQKSEIEVKTPFLQCKIAALGGKIIELKANGVEWVAQGQRERNRGIGKLWFKDDKQMDDSSCQYRLLTRTLPNGGYEITADSIIAGLAIKKTYLFSLAPTLELGIELSNSGTTGHHLNYHWHHCLNIGRTLDEHAEFKISTIDGDTVLEYLLSGQFDETLSIPQSPFMAITDSRDNSLVFATEKQAVWYSWLGRGIRCGTVEMPDGPVTIEPGTKYHRKMTLHAFAGLPAIGAVDRDFACAPANPGFKAVALRGQKNWSGELKIESGNSYPLRRKLLKPGELLEVPLSSLADPGARIFCQDEKSTKIPNAVRTFPDSRHLQKPSPYVELSSGVMPRPSENSICYFPSDYHTKKISASTDIPTMIAFGQSVNGRVAGSTALHLWLPKGGELLGGRFVKTIEKRPPEVIKKMGFDHFRIEFNHSPAKSRGGMTELIIRCSENMPANAHAYYTTEYNGKLAAPESVPFEIVRIPKVPTPRKLFTAFWGLHGTLNAFPDASSFERIGMVLPNQKYFTEIILRGMLEKHNAARFFLRFEAREPDSFCLDRNGERNGPLACPTYRGADFRSLLEEGFRAIDDGVLLHGFDPERSNGHEICFCDRCRKTFAAEQPQSVPPDVDRRRFTEMIDNNPPLAEKWLEFKQRHENDRYRHYRKAMRDYLAAKKGNPDEFKMLLAAQPGWTNPQKTRATSLQDPKMIAEFFDIYAPMIYIELNGRFRRQADLREIPRELAAIRAVAGEQIRVVPILSAGYPFTDFNANMEPGVMKAQILEALAAGARGFIVYSEGWFDAGDMKEIAEAMKLIMKDEDLFSDGVPVKEDEIGILDNNAFVSALRSADGSRAAVLVSEYSSQPRTVRVSYPCKQPVKVIDAETDMAVAELSPENNTFSVQLEQCRTKLFFIVNL